MYKDLRVQANERFFPATLPFYSDRFLMAHAFITSLLRTPSLNWGMAVRLKFVELDPETSRLNNVAPSQNGGAGTRACTIGRTAAGHLDRFFSFAEIST